MEGITAKISSIMKEPGKKYNDEDNMLVNDLRSIVSKARSKAFAAVNYSLVERNWRIGQRIWNRNRTEHHVLNTESM